jgi:hypothetical protein
MELSRLMSLKQFYYVTCHILNKLEKIDGVEGCVTPPPHKGGNHPNSE